MKQEDDDEEKECAENEKKIKQEEEKKKLEKKNTNKKKRRKQKKKAKWDRNNRITPKVDIADGATSPRPTPSPAHVTACGSVRERRRHGSVSHGSVLLKLCFDSR